MTEHSEKYWNNLIDQYKERTISVDDRYKLEKKALDDPFLFDALEGYALYNEKAAAKKDKTKLLTLPRMAAAASLVFLVSMVFLMKNNVTQTESKREAIAMVVTEEKNAQDSDENFEESISTSQTEKISGSSGSVISKDQTPTKKESDDSPSTTGTSSSQSTTIEKKAPEKIPAKEKTQTVNSDNISKEKTKAPTASKNYNTISEEAVIANDHTLPPIRSEADVLTTSTEDSELESEEMADISVSADMGGNTKSKKKAKPSISYDAQPLIGKTDFDDYIAFLIDERDKNEGVEKLRQNPTQQIVIEFTIRKDGSVDDFTHIVNNENDCSPCGAFAIAILQKSGTWKTLPTGEEGRARYTFEF